MVGWVPFLDGHEKTAAGGANLAGGLQFQLNTNPILLHLGGQGRIVSIFPWGVGRLRLTS